MKAKFFQLLEEMNKADPRFTVYAKALLFYYMPNQGELFITHNWYIADLLGIHEKTLLKAKKELVNRGVICVDPAYSGKKNNRISGTYVTVNYNWKTTNDRILNNVIQNNVIQNDVILNNGIQRGALIREKDLHRENDLPRENDLKGKDLTREKAEGAAAKPQPAPPPGTASKESSFPETPQGQQNGNKYQIPLTVPEVMEQGPRDLWGEPERVPEKPKKKPKGKGKAKQEFIPPTLEEVIADIEIKLEKKRKREFWTSDQIRNFADDFMEHYTDPAINWTNKYGDPIQSWRLTLATWLKNVDYLPPERTTRNQPGRARGQVTTAARIMEMAGNTDPQRILEQRRERENQKGNVIIQD
ncbi:hypothetical protein [Succinimonas sp.]|uniref:hypothetical protein n=1 Tax=Succinimonas sp. TaxID=1936151 RepID=UPI00386F7218